MRDEKMKKVIEELTLNYGLITRTKTEEISKHIKLSEDVIYAFEALMQSINKAYTKNIIPKKTIRAFLKKDRKGNAYLKVIGRDRNTKLIIRSDNSKYLDYLGIEGYKVNESLFAKTLDIVQKERLAQSGVAKRFLKEVVPEIDLYEEMDIEAYIQKCKEIEKKNNEPEIIESFEEPENSVESKIRKESNKESKERIHPVIPYELRKEELVKHNHKKIIRFKGKKTDREFDAYIYIKHGYILAIIEPLSGLGYQYNLTLGFAEDYNEELVQKMLKAALEIEEEIVLKDEAIIRKNHTTIENFTENIKTFLYNQNNDRRFLNKVETASKVYERKK